MKKILIISLLVLLSIGVYITIDGSSVINKVVYGLVNDYKQLSLDSKGETILTDEVIVQLKLDIEDFSKVTNINPSDQNKYRKKAKEYYNKLNNEYLSSINLKNYESVYVSTYSPYIEFTFQMDKYFKYELSIANTINQNNKIETAYIKENIISKEGKISNAMYVAGAAETYANRTYTGAGVKVGVLEPGLVDGSAECFSEGQVTTFYQETSNQAIADHSTYMAAYIAGCDGVAPDAEIYSACLTGHPALEIDWMLDNDVCLINMSYGDATPTGEYASDSAYMDFIVSNYHVTMVGAVGNYGSTTKLVGNPALAYNVIGVGSANYGGYPDNFSSYIEYSGGPKPTIMAKGNGVGIPSLSVLNSGTSVSCALVTGLIALLMEQYPYLKQCPELVMSLLVSSAYQVSGAITLDNGLTESNGAGLIRYDYFDSHLLDFRYIVNGSGNDDTFIYTRNLFLSGNYVFKVCISWTAYATGYVHRTALTNYDMYLYDSEGNVIASACSTDSNIELIVYNVTMDGDYVLKIKQVGPIKKQTDRLYMVNGEMPRYLGAC